jgi:hypothetical protein
MAGREGASVRAIAFVLSACLIGVPSLAFAADQADASAPDVVATAAGTPTSPTDSSLSRWLDDAPPVAGQTANGQTANGQNGAQTPLVRQIHGEASVSVGTGGYRDLYLAATMPIGKDSALGVAIEDTQLPKPWKGEARSLYVNLAVGGASAAPADCDAAVHVGDRYLQPLWVRQFRDPVTPGDDLRCLAAESGPKP